MDAPTVSGFRLVASYAGLIGVNVVFGAGLFGVPTNKTISDAYPSSITPAGFAFSIWGPIFLLEGGGVALMASGATKNFRTRAAWAWVACWGAECAWQLVFAQAPIPANKASRSAKLLVLIPAALLLISAYGSMLVAAARLRFAPEEGESRNGSSLNVCVAGTWRRRLAEAVLIDLPTGLNTGWLAAAAGIGVSLVAPNVPAISQLGEPSGGAVLVTVVSGLGAVASAVLGSKRRTLLVGAGYAAATAWACYGITKAESVSEEVKTAAARGIWLAACGAGTAAASALVDAWYSRNSAQEPLEKSSNTLDGVQRKPLLK